jgi:hypothetical protein
MDSLCKMEATGKSSSLAIGNISMLLKAATGYVPLVTLPIQPDVSACIRDLLISGGLKQIQRPSPQGRFHHMPNRFRHLDTEESTVHT